MTLTKEIKERIMKILTIVFAKGFFSSEFVLCCVLLYLASKDTINLWAVVCMTAVIIVYIIARTHSKSPYSKVTHTTINT